MCFSYNWLRLAGGVAACLGLVACAASAGGFGETGGQQAAPPLNDATVRFDDPRTLLMTPGETQAIGVACDPPAPYEVGFSIVGDASAWLDQTKVTANAATGHALVQLHAPAYAAAFHVRASLLDANGAPGPSAERTVAVGDQGYGTVRVLPVYSGTRAVTKWTADVVVGTTCEGVKAVLPKDPPGALSATAAPGGKLAVGNVPVGPVLAVVVRAGHFAWGCSDATKLTPSSLLDVSVDVIDKPLDLTSASLAVDFTYDASGPMLAPLFADAAALLGEAFLPSESSDGSVLLNAMQALLAPADGATFAMQRSTDGWDAIADGHFAGLPLGPRAQLEVWAATGILIQPMSLRVTLSPGTAPESPAATVTAFGDVDAAGAGVALPAFTWSAQPNDNVLLAGDFTWEPSRFAGSAALGPALVQVPEATTLVEALAMAAGCHDLATALDAFGSCDSACLEALCAQALEARLDVALAASAASPAAVTIKATAAATVGDTAEPTTLAGHWIGTFSDAIFGIDVSGDVSAAPAP